MGFRSRLALWSLPTLLAFAAAPAPAQVTAGGKHAAFAAVTGITLNDGNTGVGTLLQVVLPKGRKKSVLAIEAAMQVDVSQESLPSLEVKVNGMSANGPAVSVDCKFVGVERCPLAGSWWLDLDAAEAASPGTFVKKPLTVELLGGSNTVAPPTTPQADVTLSVSMLKK
jgi:hypothetical protein